MIKIASVSDRTSVFLQLTVMTLRITEECSYKIRHNKLLIRVRSQSCAFCKRSPPKYDRTSVFLQLTVMTLTITEECPFKI
ncbi:hypothetical protein [Nostoc sp. DSM 114159]